MDSLIVFLISFFQASIFFLILLSLFAILSKLAHCLSGLPREVNGPWRNSRPPRSARGLWRNTRGNHSRRNPNSRAEH